SRRRVTASSVIGRSPARRVVGVPEQDPGAADGDGVAVEQGGGLDAVALDVGAVGGAEVRRHRPVRSDAQLEMAAGDAGVLHDDVRLGAAADDGDRAGEEVALAVDVDHRVAGGGGGRGCRGGAAAAGGGVDVEPAGGDGLVGLEPDD